MSNRSSTAEVCCYQRQQQQQQQQPQQQQQSQRTENFPSSIKTLKTISVIKLKSNRKVNKHKSISSPIKPPEELDQNNNLNNYSSNNQLEPANCERKVGGEESQAQHSCLLFKYQVNSSHQDIEELRELLREERRLQMRSNQMSAQEIAFYASDYERMMLDDWLVTRFILRGTKAFERDASEQEKMDAAQGDLWNAKSARRARRAILQRSLELIKVCAKFRFEHQINGQTKLEEFPLDWTKVEGLIHCKPDLVGNPTAYLRVCLHKPKLIEAPEARNQFKRYMLYLLECCDRDLFNAPGKAICCVFDMTNAGLENIDLELTSWMIKSFKSSSPKLLCYVVVYNPPWFFTATFKVICNTLLSSSKRQSVKFAYGNEILNYVSYANLPSYLKSTIQ